MEFKIRAIETKVVAIENGLAIVWDNMRNRFNELSKLLNSISTNKMN